MNLIMIDGVHNIYIHTWSKRFFLMRDKFDNIDSCGMGSTAFTQERWPPQHLLKRGETHSIYS